MSPASEQITTILGILLRRTEGKEVAWEPTDEETVYITTVPSGSIIVESVDRDGRAPFRLSIVNKDGVLMDSVTESRGSGPLGLLYAVIQRQVAGIDEVLDKVLRELQEGTTSGDAD